MNNISEQILQAIEIIADEKISKLGYDKTIKATIWRIVDLDAGEYKVRYNGNIFSAFSNDLSKTYKVDEAVYVTVPEGNFGNKKLITSVINKQSLSDSQLTILQNSITPLYPNINDMYDTLYDKDEEFRVIAGVQPDDEGSFDWICEPRDYTTNALFQQYATTYDLIRIQASFKTQFHDEHVKGNYGIEVVFYTNSNDEKDNTVSYKLELNSFNGDPYRLSVYSPQSVIIKAQKNYLVGVKSIKLFEEGFDFDRYYKNGLPTDNWNTDTPNIFAKDITIEYVERKDYSDSNYYLTISAVKGIILTDNISSLDLMGRIIYRGKDIMDSSIDCQWYERDLSVTVGKDTYDRKAGFGWRKLDEKTNRTLTVDSTNVINQQRYKLLATYNNIQLSQEIEVFNQNSGYKYEIAQITRGDDILLQLVNNYNDKDLHGDWYVSYPDGSYTLVEGDKNSISIGPYLKYSSATFYCAVRSYDYTSIVGTLEKTIVTSTSEDDLTISYDGEDVFRYDANGDITIEDSEKERTLRVKVAWKEGHGISYNVKWFIDGKEVTEGISNPRPPANSMIEKLWVDRDNILHYTIRQKYKQEYNNNTLQVSIIPTAGESIPPFYKEILFIKDGDQGTNGTTYIMAIRPYDTETGLKKSGFNPLRYDGGWVNDTSLPLQCYVYKNGEPINKNPDYDIEYSWTGINIWFSEHTGEDYSKVNGGIYKVTAHGQGTISSTPDSADLQFYIKVAATITNNTMNKRKITIYAMYPVDILVGSLDQTKVESTIPSYIKYTASGNIPTSYSNSIYLKYDGNETRIDSLNKKVLDIEDRDGPKYLRPASSFIFENKDEKASNIGVLKCTIRDNEYVIHPIVMYLDTYGNEAINGWDGQELVIDEKNKQYIYAPQIGAGEKDSQNRFTGVVMGKDTLNDKIGLYGYQNGINTFGLIENGKAYFGAKSGGGQIVLDGTSAKIYGGGNYPAGAVTGAIGGNAENGMTIILANLNPDEPDKTDAIRIAKDKFFVRYDGSLTATKAIIKGDVTADSGKIGNWYIDSGAIKNRRDSPTVQLTSEGKIEAREGTIGGWTLASNKLYSTRDGNVGIASSGNAAFWAGTSLDESSSQISPTEANTKFLVTRSGKLYCTNAEISGTVKATKGEFGGWKIASNGLYYQATDVSTIDTTTQRYYLSPTAGIRWGDNFIVSSSGNVTAKGNIYAKNLYLGSDESETINVGNELNGAKLRNGSVADRHISGLSTSKLNGTISTGMLSGTISAQNIDVSGVIQAGNIATTNLVAQEITAATANVDTLIANKIQAAEISGDQIKGGTITGVQFQAINSVYFVGQGSISSGGGFAAGLTISSGDIILQGTVNVDGSLYINGKQITV